MKERERRESERKAMSVEERETRLCAVSSMVPMILKIFTIIPLSIFTQKLKTIVDAISKYGA